MGACMEQNLNVNTKLLSFNGVIGRRDYLLNIVYICMINIIFTIPYSIWMFANIETMADIYNFSKVFVEAPMFLKLWVLVGTAFTLTLSISNLFRRVNDIIGRVSNTVNILCAVWVIFSGFGMVLVPLLAYLGSFVCFIIGLILIFTPGKITSKMPYDITKIFNWGAFLGTWIWGLFNKSWLTPWGFYFQLVCGLKGNEWAYKNKKCTDVEAFNKSQRKQTTIWAILIGVLVPLMYILLVVAMVMVIALAAVDDSKNNGTNQTMTKFERFVDGYQSLYFEHHVITESENKYYVLPSDWAKASFSDKKEMLDIAATSAAMERSKKYPEVGYTSKTTELSRTKIYSSKNGELLGEFIMDESQFSNITDAKSAIVTGFKAAMNAYRFYKPTMK